MIRTKLHGRLRIALGLALAGIAGSAALAPVQAQASSRFRVLVPALQGAASGAKIADLVRKNIDMMDTHVSIAEKEVKAAVKKLGAKEKEMGCLQYRQLMQHVDAKLTMCGQIEGGQVVAQFFNPDGSSYDVPAFAYTTDAAAAEQITKGFGAYVQMLQVLAFCDDYLNSSQWQDALNNCTKAAEANPKSTRALYARASALRGLEQHQEALAAFQKVLELDPINQEAMLSASMEARLLENAELADKYLNEYLELNPGDAQVRMAIASKLAKDGDYRGALAVLEKAVGPDTANLQIREYAGHFAMSAGGKALTQSKGEVTPLVKDLFEKALKHYGFVATAQGDTVNAVLLRGIMAAHGALGHTDEAISWGQRAVAHKDADAQAWSAYADQLMRAGKNTDALAALDKVAQLDATVPVKGKRAIIYADLGRASDAVTAVRAAREAKELSDAQADGVAQKLIAFGYERYGKASQFDAARPYYSAGREIATTERTRDMANFLEGYGIYQQAAAIAAKSTLAGAKQSLPLFERAKALIQSANQYGGDSRAGLLDNIGKLLERQQAIIKAAGG